MSESPIKLKLSWKSLVALAVTAAALAAVFRKVNVGELWSVMSGARWPWLLAAVGLYGFGGLLASTRFHFMLRLTGADVHPGATLRIFFIGHFFNLLLFGPAAGDVAKSALYSKWYDMRMSKVVAAAPLDRLLGLAGLVLFTVLGLGIAFFNGAFESMSAPLRLPMEWLIGVGVLGVAALAGLIFWRPTADTGLAKTWMAFIEGGSSLLKTPKIAFIGLALGFGVQVVLGTALALCLMAVTDAPVSLLDILWVFPAISALTALPSVAGLGLREGAALALLGLYAVPEADIVAATLLFMGANLVWIAVGGLTLWRETQLRQQYSARWTPPKDISVVIPALNEEVDLPITLEYLKPISRIREIIVVDGGSSDATRDLAKKAGCTVLKSPPGRGGQMRLGAEKASGDVILMLHADTWLEPEAGEALLRCLADPVVVAGGYWKDFRDATWHMTGSKFRCLSRIFASRRIVGDQGFFVRREVLEKIGGIPNVPLMEEFELCKLLNREGRLGLAGSVVSTSARRFYKLGPIRTYARMAWVTALYRLGVSHEKLRRIYEKD